MRTGFSSWGGATDNLKIKADLRIRYELRVKDEPDPADRDVSRDRMRTRFRLGMVWKNSAENWEAGAGLATGGDEATSTNETWSNNTFFETGDIRLDYAYAKHKLGDRFRLIAGQQKMPWEASWLLWDSDVRPAGFTLTFDMDGLFAVAGAYVARQYGNNMGKLYLGQVGYRLKTDYLNVTVAASYQPFNQEFNEQNQPNPDYDYQVGDLYAVLDVPVGEVTFSAYGDWFKNFGASGKAGEGVLGQDLVPGDGDQGWVAGVKGKFKGFSLGFAYAEVGADSCFGPLKDSDFGSGLSETDLKGYVVEAAYKITKHFSISAEADFYDALKRVDEPKVSLYQIDLNYKF